MTRSTTPTRRELLLDWMFLVGVFLKGLDGLVEVIVGAPLLVMTQAQVAAIAGAVTAEELAEDPRDVVANLVLRGLTHLGADGLLIAGIYLLVHGLVKLGIVAALVRGSRRAYPWAVGALGALLALQLVDLALRPSAGVLLLSLLDAVIIWLTVREWRHGRSLRDIARLRAPRLFRR